MDKLTVSIVSDFYKKIENKKRVIFGAGPTAEEFMKNFAVAPIYIVDNDQTLWGKSFFGIDVRQPKTLVEENIENIVVIIASTDIKDILTQLKKYGFNEDENILISPLLVSDQDQNFNDIKSILVSCSGVNGGVYQIEFNDGPILNHVYTGDCRGLAKEGDYIYVIEEHTGIVKLDFEYNIVKKNKTPGSFNLHGISTDPSRNIIYVNETKFDRIGVYDNPRLKKIDEINFVKNQNENNDLHHINDIKFYNNKLYVMMFSLNGVWQNHVWNDGGIVCIDVKKKEIEKTIISGLSQPHSLLLDKNDIFYCNSSERNIYHGDKLLCQFSGYTRGLAKLNDYFLVGQSKSRRLNSIRGKFTNISMDAGIHIWNSNIKTSNFIKIPAENIFDILILK